jgi:dihydropteroate synthase
MTHVERDPIEVMLEFFDARLQQADRFGMRARCILDPGTGFAPPDPQWDERYRYQRHVFTNLARLRSFGLPLYVALPWERSPDHEELLAIVVREQPEWGRSHHPEHVRAVERELGVG